MQPFTYIKAPFMTFIICKIQHLCDEQDTTGH